MTREAVDVIVIGSGIAGLMTAHLLADHLNVIMITKSSVKTSNSSKAQGGMAASISPVDHWTKHFNDTTVAGQHHHRLDHLELLVRRAPNVVKTLEQLGVPFDRNEDGTLQLGMEGAHSCRRIVHASGDKTGEMFVTTLVECVKNRINLYENTFVRRLLQKDGKVVGVEAENNHFIYAKAVIVATGGVGALYPYTSNVKEATGDGFALAYRAGASLIDMEFIQFHPTLFIKDDRCYGLISEAVRGEGAFLVNDRGERILKSHPLGDLAPRDIVSRAIYAEMKKGNSVYLDCSKIDRLQQKFPSLYERLQKVKIENNLLPVAPGAHFISGGIETDINGKTDVEGLYALGEVACTGVHGANRLASNSLLEGLVFAEQIATHILSNSVQGETEHEEQVAAKMNTIIPSKAEIQQKMDALVGIERDEHRLTEMKQWLAPFLQATNYVDRHDDRHTLERKNMLITASLITNAAIIRTESRGGHYRSDYPYQRNEWQGITLVQQKNLSSVVKKKINEEERKKDESSYDRGATAAFFS